MGAGYAVLGSLVGELLGSPWLETISYLSLGFYVWGAGRLAPGSGGLPRRPARALLWGVLLGLCVGVLGFACLYLLPVSHTFFGVDIASARITPGQYLVTTLLQVLGPFILARTLLDLWAAGRARLRWRLVYTYLLI